MYQRTLELLDDNKFGRYDIHLLSEREPRGDRKNKAESLYEKSPETQKRVEDITANDLWGGMVIKRQIPASRLLLTAFISGTANQLDKIINIHRRSTYFLYGKRCLSQSSKPSNVFANARLTMGHMRLRGRRRLMRKLSEDGWK
jgi:hypothetical protein